MFLMVMYMITTILYITVCCGHNVKVLEMTIIEEMTKPKQKMHNVTDFLCAFFKCRKALAGRLGVPGCAVTENAGCKYHAFSLTVR